MNTNTDEEKSIAEETSRDFEKLAFIAIKSELGKIKIIEEELTSAINDGGYDGKFIYCSDDKILKTLFEAKLRSNVNADLPLNDFAKALIIAVTRHADSIYIVTNLHFSKGTIEKISSFSEYSEIDIRLYNGFSINKFITENNNLLKDISKKLINFLLSSDVVKFPQALVKQNSEEITNHPIDEKLVEEIRTTLKMFKLKKQKMIVTGSPHMGKTYYIEQLVCYLKSNNINIQLIDVSKCLTYKQLFIELLEKTFGLSIGLIDLLDNNAFNEAFKEIGIYTTDLKDIKTLNFIFSRQDNIEYDYSIIFLKISKLFNKLFEGSKKRRHFVIAFLNLSIAEKEV